MQLTYRGSVNRWECDENDHLNVRFYVDKHWQALSGALSGQVHHAADSEVVDVPNLQRELQRDLQGALQVQHLRFHQESRIATPLSGYTAVIGVTPEHTDVLTELQHSFSGDTVSTCVHRVQGRFPGVATGAEILAPPQYAAPRGIADTDLDWAGVALEKTTSLGFRCIGMGAVQAYECLPSGNLQVHHYMGRISDSMPHLWGLLEADGAAPSETVDEGGAVLEYRLRYHQPLRLGAAFTVMSGIKNVSTKVQNFAHLMFNADTAELCVSAEAAAVRMDLQARRAVVLSDARQDLLRQRILSASSA